MSVDYDLVILGGSAVGRYAAATAASSLNARVALVEPHSELELGSRECGLMALHQVSQFTESIGQARQLGWVEETEKGAQFRLNTQYFDRPIRWASEVLTTASQWQSPAVLSGLGIDVIHAEGEFCREPRLSVVANGRILRSRRYLIATGSRWATAKLDGLARVGYLTPETLGYWVKKGQAIPENFVILGNDPKGVELAQILVRLGSSVTLITSRSQILPYEDPEIARWVQSQLEAEGVRILTQTQVTQVRKIQGKKWVQAGDRAIETDEILLAISQVAHLKSLNLEAAGVGGDRGKLLTNTKLQTTNPRIYVCGDALGGYSLDNLSQYEAQIAIKNALLLPLFSVSYQSIPWSIGIDPPLARVGYTEPQARSRYGSDVVILKHYFQALFQAQARGKTTGFCKAIVRQNGAILGVHIWGASAEELIHPFALAIQQKLTLEAIAYLVPVSPSFSEIYHHLGTAWRRHRQQKNSVWQNRLKNWHNWQRDRLD
jgi:pyruvate/2-oxoglutarate dehydrogenase complex dihydrolipoamide dehydrogenase (E3) component